MQGDLISKSELLESLNDWIDENTDINTILRWIEEYEIAYDVEKVVAELEERSYQEAVDDMDAWSDIPSMVVSLKTAIGIVRNGGKE